MSGWVDWFDAQVSSLANGCPKPMRSILWTGWPKFKFHSIHCFIGKPMSYFKGSLWEWRRIPRHSFKCQSAQGSPWPAHLIQSHWTLHLGREANHPNSTGSCRCCQPRWWDIRVFQTVSALCPTNSKGCSRIKLMMHILKVSKIASKAAEGVSALECLSASHSISEGWVCKIV